MAVPSYMIAVYVLIPLVVILLLILVFYLLCSKRYKLNWFERSILEEDGSSKEILCQKENDFGTIQKTSSFSSASASSSTRRPSALLPPISPLPTERDEDFYIPNPDRIRAYSFAAPPRSLRKTEEGSPLPSPDRKASAVSIGGTGLQEITFNFQTEDIMRSVSTVQVPSQRQGRRASMQDRIDLSKLDRSLYDKRQNLRKMQSTASEDSLGSINFSLDYNRDMGLLCIRLIQAIDLQSRTASNGVNPYCKMHILPKKQHQVKTKTHEKTTHPEFEEEFVFEVPEDEKDSATLEILVYDYDVYSQDECIGCVHFPLRDLDLKMTEKVVLWKGIVPCEKKEKGDTAHGDLMFSLTYLSTAERLTVDILKARNLTEKDDGKAQIAPFVKVFFIQGGRKVKKKRTRVIHGASNPVWNEALVFHQISNAQLKTSSVELEVFDSKMPNSELIGRVRVGADSQGEEYEHWLNMLQLKQACTIARWHPLTL